MKGAVLEDSPPVVPYRCLPVAYPGLTPVFIECLLCTGFLPFWVLRVHSGVEGREPKAMTESKERDSMRHRPLDSRRVADRTVIRGREREAERRQEREVEGKRGMCVAQRKVCQEIRAGSIF